MRSHSHKKPGDKHEGKVAEPKNSEDEPPNSEDENSKDGSDVKGGQTTKLYDFSSQVTPPTLPQFWALPKLEHLQMRQLKDPDIAPIIRWKEVGLRPLGKELSHTSPATRHYWLYWDSLVLTEGVLFRKFAKRDGTGYHLQFIVPRSMRDTVLYQMHEALSSGHLGKRKTRERLLRRFYWFKVREDADLWVDRCDKCASSKKPPKTMRAPMGNMTVGAPLDRVATDVLGPLPWTPRGNRYILAVTDYFTKWTEVYAIPDQSASTCAYILLEEFFMRFGFPLSLHSDQGKNYESRLMAELCEMLEIRKTRTSPGHPTGNGQVERFNRTLIRMVKVYLKGEQTEWDRHLGCLAGAYRGTIQESTGLTPNLMMLGREVDSPVIIMFGTHHHESYPTCGEYVAQLKAKMQHAHDVAREHLGEAVKRYKELYDTKVNAQQYEVGDLVWLETDISQLDVAPKLRVPYEGPYMVWRITGPLDYELYISKKKKKVVHHNRLKPYLGLRRPAGYYKVLAAAKSRASLAGSH